MAQNSKIEWTDATWNPIAGCSKVSKGCDHCYAIGQAHRMASNPATPMYHGLTQITNGRPNWSGKVTLVESALELPLRWKKPRKIFVNSMSDLFHEAVPDEWIDRIFAMMALCPQHTFQILTKRAARMRDYVLSARDNHITAYMQFPANLPRGRSFPRTIEKWPLPNVWLGVSVEDQATADERIPLLLQTPAAVRWVSYEPALGPVDFETFITKECNSALKILSRYYGPSGFDEKGTQKEIRREVLNPSPLAWIVCGGESGPGARPMHPDWARAVRDQCVAAGVPFFFKQWGEYSFEEKITVMGDDPLKRADIGYRVGKKAAGRLLDGREWNQFPS